MSTQNWIKKNTRSLAGKTYAVTGSTGGIGKELCRHLAALGADLILMDRNRQRSESFGAELEASYPGIRVDYITMNLEDMDTVVSGCEMLKAMPVDGIIHNAGAYSIPRHKCTTGLDNVFQINFFAPYYITKELLPCLRERDGRVIAVGSVAHNYSKTDPSDVDFSTRKKASLVYGNAKRYLMFAMHELFRGETAAHLAVTHPGITFTNITAHYPKLIFAVIKHPMKVIFMKPKAAALSILDGVFRDTPYGEWTGPALFDVWGHPKTRMLRTCTDDEKNRIFRTAEELYNKFKENV